MMSPQQLTPAPVGHGRTRGPDPERGAARGPDPIPRRLPPRYDGQPLQHLSHSSYNRFVLCPEDWRRRYMLGEKTAPSGSMFLGRQVDDAITLYYRHILDHGEHLSLDQVKDAFWDGWKAAAEAEREQLGIAWETDLREDSAFKLGLDAVELTFSELIPHLGEPGRRPAEGRVHARARARVVISGCRARHRRRSANLPCVGVIRGVICGSSSVSSASSERGNRADRRGTPGRWECVWPASTR